MDVYHISHLMSCSPFSDSGLKFALCSKKSFCSVLPMDSGGPSLPVLPGDPTSSYKDAQSVVPKEDDVNVVGKADTIQPVGISPPSEFP